MRTALACLLLCLPLSAAAKPRKKAAAPVAPLVAAQPTPAPVQVIVTLKDGQAMTGLLKTYDELLLVVANARGKIFSLPWAEVASVSALSPSPDAALMQQYLRPGPAEVVTLMAPKSPQEAWRRALWPGVLVHGAGYRAAGDNETFLNLAGGEIFSAVLLGFGLAEALGPGIPGETKITSESIAVGGGVIFLATWVWDLCGAPSAARDFNAKNDLALLPVQGGAELALGHPF
jgi:hypothetical protein